jgi:nucleotide-binding universal stress UspA family protein
MSSKHVFATLRRVLVPVVYGSKGVEALRAALALGAESVVSGFVRVARGEALSSGATRAAEVRRALRAMAAEGARVRARVRVSYDPWLEIMDVAGAADPDLLILEWPSQLEAIGVEAAEVLARPPCDMALVRGPFIDRPGKVLVPVRGGPHAELALRLGLSLRPDQLIALHLTRVGEDRSEAPFRGIEQVLRRMPEVEIEYAETDDPAQAILDRSGAFDLVLMGSTTQLTRSRASFGTVADRVLREAPVGVVVVKTRRRMEAPHTDEGSITGAISILVDKWFAENTYAADEFSDLDDLVRRKREQGVTISLALPALNEEKTVGRVIRTMQRALMEEAPLLDEIVLIDSHSTDRTRGIAVEMGVPVYIHQELLPELGARPGKGEALWKSLLVTRGDIVAWIDTDIDNIHPRFVYGIVGPLLIRPRLQLVKGFYRRPLHVSGRLQAGGGGRATELTARRCSIYSSPSCRASFNLFPVSTPGGGRCWRPCLSPPDSEWRPVC